MAPFRVGEFWGIDWHLMQKGSVALYWRDAYLREDCARLAERGYRILRVDCAAWQNEGEATRAVAASLDLGLLLRRGLADLADAIEHLDVPERGGLVLVLLGYDGFAEREPRAAQRLLDLCERASRYALLLGRRFMTLVQSNDPRAHFQAVGACPVHWNPREEARRERDPDWRRTEEERRLALLMIVRETFELDRRLVLLPGVGAEHYDELQGRSVVLRRPDGSSFESEVQGLDMHLPHDPRDPLPVSLAPEVARSAVPVGTELWLGAEDAG